MEARRMLIVYHRLEFGAHMHNNKKITDTVTHTKTASEQVFKHPAPAQEFTHTWKGQ